MKKCTLSLRERRRNQTAEEIQRTTLHLAESIGYEHVTAELIATEAGISVRTFFNYYPNKLAAAVGPEALFPDEAIAHFATGKGTLLDDAAQLMVDHMSSRSPEKSTIEIIIRLADKVPELARAFMDCSTALIRQLSSAIIERNQTIDPVTADLIARVIMLGFSAAIGAWSTDKDMTIDAAMEIFVNQLRSVATAIG
ncbi:TetR/AcrR family transcriptional regulator [Pararhodobacter zhoushanensis]|uniref:TetR/AcrR family transcriptional regulator n=1 Tax=Pararhodobacter zhoushanensis TaxID=2479545 RepID=UPI000F8D0E34|nr:TetR/AcrR family transcriptional regulator [Pararhodobacter zhoushanensis]